MNPSTDQILLLAGDEMIPMAALGWDERTLRLLLDRWLPPVVGPSGAQLLLMTRAPEQVRLEEEHDAARDG